MFRKSAALGFALLGAGTVFFAGWSAEGPSQSNYGTVKLFLGTECPASQAYSPRISELIEAYRSKGFEFELCFPQEGETRFGVREFCKDRGLAASWHIDVGGEEALKLGVERVPSAVVLDKSGRIRYQGAIDDNKDPSRVRERHLAKTLDAVIAGKNPPITKAEADGCVLMPGKRIPSKVTYAEHTKLILDRSCVNCHRSGQLGPFSLQGYENARKWAPMIAETTGKRTMPPWLASKGFNHFRDDISLSEYEISLLARWDKSGAPRGDVRKEPGDPKYFTGEWRLGKPDLVVAPEEPYEISAGGDLDLYRRFIIPTNFSETKWIKAADVVPGNKAVVHHVIIYLDERGATKDPRNLYKVGKHTFAKQDLIPDASLGGWAPGGEITLPADGLAFELKPGTTIFVEVHYHKTGKPETDLTKIGLYFAKEPIKKVVSLAWLPDPTFRIPPGKADYTLRSSWRIPSDVTLHTITPHMHNRGKSTKVELVLPDGSKKPIILIENWDFGWQRTYFFAEPIKAPAGSKIIAETVFDNSAENPRNPIVPPVQVTWGEKTSDEMMLLVIAYTIDKGFKPSPRFIGFGTETPEKP